MFENLTEKLGGVLRGLAGRGRLTERNIQDALAEVRTALLEADVNYQVARDFIDRVSREAIGREVLKTLRPEQVFVKVIHDEMVRLMGPVDPRIPFQSPGPTVLMMAGLQGSGKTTTAGKLARLIQEKGHRPMLVACDCQRPAAIEQLMVVGAQVDTPVYSEGLGDPVRIAKNGVRAAAEQNCDVVIVDTAGRLHIDQAMMQEAKDIARAVKPHQIYLVCDAMTGQDAVASAKEFNAVLELSAVILTKLDGDARGGAALSVKAVTGKPIQFVGMGEKLDRLEEFHPDRMANRILGMGDVVGLVEKAQATVDADEAARLQEKLRKAEFGLDDFLKQIRQMRRMGPLKDILAMIPGMGSAMKDLPIDDKELDQTEAIINSMTPRERTRPDIIDAPRRRRIARGSGMDPQDVSSLVKSFGQVKDLVRQMHSAGAFGGGRAAVAQQMASVDLFGHQRKKRQRSARKKKDRKKRSR
ncbi:MAG TPA: signal recognition particle protein [Phycisphaerae bacterium]|nr:signal recognition particle protein [Phycisphaerae bacterium]